MVDLCSCMQQWLDIDNGKIFLSLLFIPIQSGANGEALISAGFVAMLKRTICPTVRQS